MSDVQKQHSTLDDFAIDWGRIETWCEMSSGKAICGPVLDRVQQAGRTLEAERDGLVEQLEAVVEAAREVLDYENAPSRASLSALRTALESSPANKLGRAGDLAGTPSSADALARAGTHPPDPEEQSPATEATRNAEPVQPTRPGEPGVASVPASEPEEDA